MTISNESLRAQHDGDGVSTAFSFSMPVSAVSSIQVISKVESTEVSTIEVEGSTINTTLSGTPAGSTGGTVTFVTPPPSGTTVTILLDPDLTQETSLPLSGDFPSSAVELALDKATQIAKRNRDLIGRALGLFDGDVDGSGRFDANSNRIVSLADPMSNQDAATKAYTDAQIASATLDPTTPVTTFAGTLLDDADADAFLTTLTYDQGDTGAVAYPLRERLQRHVYVTDFGAQGDGATNDDAAFTAAGNASGSVYVPDTGSAYVVTSVPDIDTFWGPGEVTVSGNRVYLKPHPGPASVIYAEIFGLTLDASADSAAALQRAITFAQDQDLPLYMPPRAQIRVDSTLTALQGTAKGAGFANRKELTILGNYCELRPNVDGPCLRIHSQADGTDFNSGEELGSIHIENLLFDGSLSKTATHTATQALVIGRAGYLWSSNEKSVLNNVRVQNFNGSITAYSVQMTNCRNFTIQDLSLVHEGGLLLEDANSDIASFCGDMWFYGCDFRGTTTSPDRRPVRIQGNDTNGANSANVEGLHFQNCFFYTGGTSLYVGEDDAIRHVYFDHCYFDTPTAGDRGVEMLCDHVDGQIDRVVIDHCDFTVFSANAIRAVATAGAIDQIGIDHCDLRNGTDGGGDTSLVYLNGVGESSIDHFRFNGITNTSALEAVIHVEACDKVSVIACKAMGTLPTNVDLVKVEDDTSCDDWHLADCQARPSGTGAVVNVVVNTTTGSGVSHDHQTMTA